ncbi:transposase [Bacteroidota bacterium]
MSGDRYIITDQNGLYFLTFTVIDWIDIFTRKEFKSIIIDSFDYCIKNKGLTINAWCLMSNHLHLICYARIGFKLSDIIRDFKKFTAKKIINEMETGNESRKDWILNRMEFRGRNLKRIKKYKFWKDDNHAILLETNKMIDDRLDYIHNNPVEAEIVDEAEYYLYSSARDYSGIKGLVDVEIID